MLSTSRARGSLAAARSLARAGWEVDVGTPDGGGMLAASWAVAVHHHVPRPRQDGQAFTDGLAAAVRRRPPDLVLGGGDDWAAALSTYGPGLGVATAHPPAAVVQAGLDKALLARAARTAGLPAPRTVTATDEALDRWNGDVVVKLRSHWVPGRSAQRRVEARWLPDAPAARAHVRSLREAGVDVLLQEPVRGRLGALAGLFHEGQLRGRVQQVADGLWPTPSGVSARARTVPVDDALVRRCEQVLRDLRWNGLVELQFLVDPEGTWHLVDLNGRLYGSLALAVAAGPDLPDAWVRQSLGLPLPPLPDARPGVGYVWEAGDLRRALAERRGGLAHDLLTTARAWRDAEARSLWDRDDPGPVRHLLLGRLTGRSTAAAGSR